MARDIINGSAFQSAIADALEGLPPALQRYRPALKTYFHRTADQHDTILKAHRRKADPAWAQRKFDEGLTLYRFDERQREDLLGTIRCQFDDLSRVAALEQNRDRAVALEAASFLRGLSHRRGDLSDPGREAHDLLQRAQSAALKARRHETLREPGVLVTGSLVASRCVSLDEIIHLGRSLENCLTRSEDYWERFVSGKIDIWSLREDHQLVAVLAVNRASNQVIEARGPLNTNISLRHIHDVALFCKKAGFSISNHCEGLLVEYAERPILGPKIVVLDKCVAEYVEWPNAVRIDIAGTENPGWPMSSRYMVLSLSFDPALSCAREILAGRDHREAVKDFGGKRLRKIVQNVALDEVTPTIVQHRLLALAA